MPRPALDEDLRPLSDFRSHVASCIRQVRKTKRPVVITHHGKPAAVLLDVSEYEALMRKMELLEDIRAAEDQLARGKGVSHESALRKVLGRVSR
jgi:antitoxin YefM